jgi:hypothetical protein
MTILDLRPAAEMRSQITAETLPSGSDIDCSFVSVTIAARPSSHFTGSQA